MKKFMIALTALMLAAAGGCSDVNDIEIPQITSVQDDYSGSMIVSFGNQEVLTEKTSVSESGADNEESEAFSERITVTAAPITTADTEYETTRAAETNAPAETTHGPVTTKPVNKTTETEKTVKTETETTVTTTLFSEIDERTVICEQVSELMTDGEYVDVVQIMEEHPDCQTDPRISIYIYTLNEHFNKAAESIYNTAADYYAAQAAAGRNCETGFEGYNIKTAQIDPSCLKKDIESEYRDAADLAVIKCVNGKIEVCIEIPGAYSCYPR